MDLTVKGLLLVEYYLRIQKLFILGNEFPNRPFARLLV